MGGRLPKKQIRVDDAVRRRCAGAGDRRAPSQGARGVQGRPRARTPLSTSGRFPLDGSEPLCEQLDEARSRKGSRAPRTRTDVRAAQSDRLSPSGWPRDGRVDDS
jgi:hypothetical protein